jgi:hypothetical protein
MAAGSELNALLKQQKPKRLCCLGPPSPTIILLHSLAAGPACNSWLPPKLTAQKLLRSTLYYAGLRRWDAGTIFLDAVHPSPDLRPGSAFFQQAAAVGLGHSAALRHLLSRAAGRLGLPFRVPPPFAESVDLTVFAKLPPPRVRPALQYWLWEGGCQIHTSGCGGLSCVHPPLGLPCALQVKMT